MQLTPSREAHDTHLRLLVVEDSEDDFLLLKLQLEDAGLKARCLRVDNAAAMKFALKEGCWDAILADYSLPDFSGLTALEMHQESGRDIPFIFISGVIGEESVIRCMKAGANDLILKGQPRLIAALGRELQEAERRRQHRASEDRYRSIVEQASDGIWTANPAGQFTFVNHRLAEILHLSNESLAGRSLLEFVAPASRAQAEQRLALPQHGGAPQALELLCSDGHKASVLLTVSPLKEGGLLGTVTDVTEVRLLQRKLAQSEKMEFLGRLAAGVAHDFNNMLGVISGFSEELRGALSDPCHVQTLQDLISSVNGAGVLIRQMLSVGRPQEMHSHVFALNAKLREFHGMLRKVVGRGVDLQIRGAAQPDLVDLDTGMLVQVILNLTINARDALNGSGQIIIDTHLETLDSKEPGEGEAGSYVVLTVTDNGHGMDEATRQRIFEPFFSTKGAERGSGLGLASVQGIVSQSKGFIRVVSKIGEGATFKIYFPAAEAYPANSSEGPSRARPPGEFTVLLLDDSTITRKVLKERLLRDGYRLLEASDGQEAVDLSHSFASPIHLLISDLLMPKMTGLEAAEIVRAQRPDIKVLFMSGQGREFSQLPDQSSLPHSFLEKPVELNCFLSEVRSLLAN